MPNRNSKKRQIELLNVSKDEVLQRPDHKAQHDSHYDATRVAKDLNNAATVKDDSVHEADQDNAPARTIRTANIAIGNNMPADFASSSTTASTVYAGPSTIPTADTFSPTAQNPQQVKQDRIASLRLATEQTNAGTARLQEVLDSKMAELQVLKDRLRALVGGNKNEYARYMKAVKRDVEAKKKEMRGGK